MDSRILDSLEVPEPLLRWLAREAQDPSDAWLRCPRPSWLLYLALALDIDRRLLVEAAHALTRDAISELRVRDLRPSRALRTAHRWLQGEATGAEAWARGFAAADAAEHAGSLSRAEAIRAASCVAFACDEAADAAYYAHQGYAARAVEHLEVLLGPERWEEAAERVRRLIPAAPVRLALERRARETAPPITLEPPALDGEETA